MIDDLQQTLVKANREIAEVRDTVVRSESQLQAVQVENKDLLEQSSCLDSEVNVHVLQVATWERDTQELENTLRTWDTELSAQRSKHRTATSGLHREVAIAEEELRHTESEISSEERNVELLSAEIASARTETEVQQQSMQELRQKLNRTRQDEASSAEAALGTIDEDVRRIAARCDDAKVEAVTSRGRCQQLENDLAAEQRRRDELGRQLRKAVAEQSQGPTRLRSLEADVSAKGLDPRDILRRHAAGELEAPSAASEAAEAAVAATKRAQLRAELAASEDQCSQLRGTVSEKHKAQAGAKLLMQQNLDNSRSEIHRLLLVAAQKQNAEVSSLQDEIATAEHRSQMESEEASALEEQLRKIGEDHLHQRHRFEKEKQADSDRAAALAAELGSMKVEKELAVQRTVTLQGKNLEMEQAIKEAAAEGDRRCAKVRSMIDELWVGIRAQAPKADVSVLGGR